MATEKRLIDADALMKYINENHSYSGLPMAAHICTMELLTYAPTVDAVEVVRCKDCVFGKGSTYKVCPLYRDGLMKDDDFCSVGERRSDGK